MSQSKRASIAIVTALLTSLLLLGKFPAPKGPEVAAAAAVEVTQGDSWGFHSSIPEALAGENATNDSQMLSGLCDGIAAIVELDGKRESPKILYAIHVFDLRTAAIMACLGESPVGGAPKYPEFNEIVGGIFSEAFPDGDEKLTLERRAELVAMFRALGSACNEASKG
tara:strand:- start:13872 stop:14375 length:504 start_codon:yes stop_codon:yes gene_type:complete